MVANLILLCSLKTYLSFETWKQFCKRIGGYLNHLFFRRASKYPLFQISQTLVYFLFLFFSFFMNNFCIAPCLFFCNKTFERQQQEFRAFIWWMENLINMFLCSPLVQEQNIFGWIQMEGMFLNLLQCRSSAYVGGVHMILILRA